VRPDFAAAAARASASLTRSSVSITSNRARASAALLVCNGPIRRSSSPGVRSRRPAQWACPSCTRFSPNTRWPAASAASSASAGWVLLTAVRVTEASSRPAAAQTAAIRPRTALKRSAMLDVSGTREEEGVMNRSAAEILWEVASVLARDAADVSRAAGRRRPDLPPLLFFTDPGRTARPWETAARLPAGSGVVFRAFGAADALDTGRRLREATRGRGGLLLIGLD